MFSLLSDNLSKIFKGLRSRGLLTEKDLDEAMREIRIALLEADVALPVVKELINNIAAKAIGSAVVKSVSPAQMVVKIVNDELTNILGSDAIGINIATTPPAVIMLVGLQGAGKTTTSVKLASFLKIKAKKKIFMASLDIYRPAAMQQLQILCKQIAIPTLDIVEGATVAEITSNALAMARMTGSDVLILDTAGRLHTDQALIEELQQVKAMTNPVETLLVVDALTGQDAVNIGKEFHDKVGVTGIILTRLDGDAKGGAALSMRVTTGAPIKFIGVGERTKDLEEFHPDRIASRILGMGDVVSLVEKAAETINEEEKYSLVSRLRNGYFDLNDLKVQFKAMKKMGGISSFLPMIPGFSRMRPQFHEVSKGEDILSRHDSVINSMTKLERQNPKILNASRKIRIAKGSGTTVQDVNKLLKKFLEISSIVKRFGKMDNKQMVRATNIQQVQTKW